MCKVALRRAEKSFAAPSWHEFRALQTVAAGVAANLFARFAWFCVTVALFVSSVQHFHGVHRGLTARSMRHVWCRRRAGCFVVGPHF